MLALSSQDRSFVKTGQRTEERRNRPGAGQPILTASGEVIPVKWIGVQTVSTWFGPAERLLPVRVAAGALGNGLPRRDFYRQRFAEFDALYGDAPEMTELTYPHAMSVRQVPPRLKARLGIPAKRLAA